MMVALPVEQMTLGEKLEAMDIFWSNLLREQDKIPVPQWHKDLLDEREQLIREGKARFSSWEAAKQRIADKIREHPNS
jgi:hypothetical protein